MEADCGSVDGNVVRERGGRVHAERPFVAYQSGVWRLLSDRKGSL